MAEIDAWADVLSAEMRSVWPILQRVTDPLEGCLMGGTALTIHLRHRVSFDLGYMTADGFSGDHLARMFEKAAGSVDIYESGADQLHARVDAVQVQVFKAPHRGANPGHVKPSPSPLR